MPKVSIIVPVYKTEPYLDRCVQSLRNQALQDIEIILVDDGSPDRCPEMCDEYAKQDKRIKVLHQKNAGVAAARNKGLEIANAEYVGFVDSDDYVEGSMYYEMYSAAEQFHCDVVLCDCLKEKSDNSVLYSHNIRSGLYTAEQLKKEYYPHLLMMEDINYPATISNYTLLFRVKQGNHSYPTGTIRYMEGIRFSEDLLFGSQLMLQANSLYYLKGKAYYHYCENLSSVTHTFHADKWTDYQRLIRECKKYFLHLERYDFRLQFDYLVLFLVYNAIADIHRTDQIGHREKHVLAKNILGEKSVFDSFTRLKILKLNISKKQKVYTFILRIQVLICALYRRVNNEKTKPDNSYSDI